jgi:hypothetical protein
MTDLSKEHKVMYISPADGFQGLAVKEKYGRNSLCPCGSGKKVKKCHPEYLETKYCSCNKKGDYMCLEGDKK